MKITFIKLLVCAVFICGGANVSLAAAKSDSLMRMEVKRYLPLLKESSYFTKIMKDRSAPSSKCSVTGEQLLKDVKKVLDLQEKLVWITPANVRKAFEDFRKNMMSSTSANPSIPRRA